VRIGDPVWAVAPARGGPADLVSGLVEGFEVFAEQDLRLFRTGLRLGPGSSGAPLLNGLGEVVGVLTIGARAADAVVDGAFALTVDALSLLLDQAGFAR